MGKATIKQYEAAVAMAKTNLDYCTIKSPVKGVIIDRRVNIGQTVVSSMSASSLFLIAKDLSRMQVWASVNEADIGRIHAGLPVHFTLATYPGETFEGKVTQVRLNAQSTQNVVTYTVVVTTDNPPTAEYPNGKLFPYMTANLKFEVERHPDVLLVPNAALRWKPQPSADRSRRIAARPAATRRPRRAARRPSAAKRSGAPRPRAPRPSRRGKTQARLGEGRRFRPPAEGPGRPERRLDDRDLRRGAERGNGGGDRREPQRGVRRRRRRHQEPVSPETSSGRHATEAQTVVDAVLPWN